RERDQGSQQQEESSHRRMIRVDKMEVIGPRSYMLSLSPCYRGPMNPLRAALLLPVLFLAACTPATWDKPGATQASIQEDGQACWERARTQARSFTTPAPDGVIVGAPADRARDRSMDETAIFQQCMRDKGYTEKR